MTSQHPIDDEALVRHRHGATRDASGPEAALATTTAARAMLDEWDRQDAALHALYDPLLDEPVPERLRASLEPAAAHRGMPRWHVIRRLAAAVLLVAVGAAGGWFAARTTLPERPAESVLAEALRAHATYSVEVAHPVEVQASDSAHLTTWLSKRLGHPIAPPDLAGEGFRLMGGRVVPDANGTAALMMYEDGSGRRITLYVAPEPGRGETAFRFADAGSARGFWWIDGNLGCAVVGDIDRDALRAIATAAYSQLVPA